MESATNNCSLTNGVADNIVGVAPLLDVLADNGGETLTHALPAGSPALDAVSAAACDVNATGWYDFAYDGNTGVVIGAGMITLVFVDGGRGDADGLANGVIVDPGAPVQRDYSLWLPSIRR